MGKEARAHGANYFAGVCVNLGYSPLWGRLQESYGEDPLLIGSMGTGLTLGARQNVLVCVKHFALNSMENLRFQVNVDCSEEVMHECFLPHFRQCIEEGGAESVMSAYNSVNGEFCGDSADLLNGVIRDAWGREDVVVTSDWVWGSRDAFKSVKAGLDVEMPLRSTRSKHLPRALRRGEIDWQPIDRIGKRVLKMQLEHYARRYDSEEPVKSEVVGCEAHRQLARKVASQGMVLLKNNKPDSTTPILPLDPKTCRRIVVVGELAKSTQTGDAGSSNLVDKTTVSPLAGLEAQAGIEVVYFDGTDVKAIEQASLTADAVFVLVGYTATDEGEYVATFDGETLAATLPYIFPRLFVAKFVSTIVNSMIGAWEKLRGKLPGGDRTNLRLRPKDEKLIGELAELVGPKMILGVEASGPVIVPRSVREKVSALLFTGYGGCRFGTALCDVIFGRSEPAGRLAYGIVESEHSLPRLDMASKSVTYDRYWGYRLLQQTGQQAAYPFGFGLGYGDVQMVRTDFDKLVRLQERFFHVDVVVENKGRLPSTTVIQIYGSRVIYVGEIDAAGSYDLDHERVLIGFARTETIGVGESRTVQVRCRLDPVARWQTDDRTFEVAEGDYRLYVSRWEGDEESLVGKIPVDRVVWGVSPA